MTIPRDRDGIATIADRFATFAHEARGSSALYAALAPPVAGDEELLELLLVAPPMQRRANLLFAAAHDLLLAGVDHPVARYYPSITGAAIPVDDAAFAAFRDLCLSHRSRLCATIASRQTQTNEVRRSVAFLPVFQRLSAEEPIALVEVGASAGLNLLVDRYRYRYGDRPWIGALGSTVAIDCEPRKTLPPVDAAPPRIAFRIGVDSHPLDAADEEDARWLMACVWPEHDDRMRLLRAALDVARQSAPRIVAGNAVDVIEDVVDQVPESLAICLFHSATVAYFTDAERETFMAILERLGRRRRLHWLSFEDRGLGSFTTRLPFDRLYVPQPGDRPTDIFGLLGYAQWTEHGRQDRLLARVHMHGRWIEWLEG